jgi:hypothetical protein
MCLNVTYSRTKVERGSCFGSRRQMKLLETTQHLRRLSGRGREPKIELRNFSSVYWPSVLDGDAHVGASNLEIRVREIGIRETYERLNPVYTQARSRYGKLRNQRRCSGSQRKQQ